MMVVDVRGNDSRWGLSQRSRNTLRMMMRLAIPTFSLMLVSLNARAQQPAPIQIPGVRYTAMGDIIVPIVFPVLGGSHWTNNFAATLPGGSGQHQGQDLPAPKMHPLLACFDGIWTGK